MIFQLAVKSCQFYKGNVDRLERLKFISHRHCIESENGIPIRHCNEDDYDEKCSLQQFCKSF